MMFLAAVLLCLALMCFSLLAVHADIASEEKPPNILLLLTDDQDVILGGADHMPNLKALVRDLGTTYKNAFVHTPICCPSRSSILSGRYLHNGGALNNSVIGNCDGDDWQQNAEKRTFAVHAKEHGYVTSYQGKYLNQYGRNVTVPPGWDKWFGLVGNSVYYNYTIVESNDGTETTRRRHGDDYDSDYLPDLLANRTMKMIEEFSKQDKPFLLVNAWPSCHAPFTPAPLAEHTFDGVKAHRTPNWNASYDSIQQKHWFVRQMAAIDAAGEAHIDDIFERRLETLVSVDQHIKLFVELLESKGLLYNTIMIFTSDNGFQLGQHRIESDKRQLYEHDIRVPFVARGPGIDEAVTSSKVVLNVDIAPTIHHIVSGSENSPKDMDGISFLGDSTRNDFLVSYHGEGFAPCNLWTCPPPQHMHDGDAKNNTYHCVRTLREQENSMYCQFLDDEGFREYYNLETDEWQLENKYSELDQVTKWRYETRLAHLRACRGETCRS